ncbi:MAG: beta strand repeat-containing protein, partial [Verrucomicrobium sp.]
MPLMLVLAATAPPVATAQTSYYWDPNGLPGPGLVWNPSSLYWSPSADGSAESVAWVDGSTAVFSAGAEDAGTIAVDGLLNIGGLKFEDGSVTLQGGLLSLSKNAAFEVLESRTAILDGVGILGDFTITKTGKGKLSVTGDGPAFFTGGLTIRGGTVELSSLGSTATGSGNILIEGQGGAVGALNPTVLRLMADNQITDTSTVTISSRQYNGSLFDLNGFDETIGGLTLAAYTGTNDIGVRTGAGGVLTVKGDIFLHNSRGGEGNNVRDVLITGTGNRGVLAPDSGYLDLGGAVRTITVASQATPTVFPDSDATIETTIQNGGIIKAGAQMLILSGTNTYTGGTTINAGTLRIGGGSTSGSIVGDVLNNSVLEFSRSNAASYAGNITGTGSFNKLAAGSLTLSGNNTFAGLVAIKGGALSVEKIGLAGSTSDTNLGSFGFIDLGDDIASVGLTHTGAGESTDKVLRLTGTTGTVTIASSGSGALVIQNALQFVGLGARIIALSGTSTAANTLQAGLTNDTENAATSLQKSGAGTWVLTGENTYAGVTHVTNGTLRISNHDITLTGDGSLKVLTTDLINYALLFGGGPVGSAGTLQMDSGRTVHLAGHVGFINSSNNNAAAITDGTLDLGDVLRVFVVNNSSNADPELTISSTLGGTTNATLMKSGSGRMSLTQPLSIKNIQVNAGRLDLGGASNTITGSLQVGMNNVGSLYYSQSGGTLTVGSGNSSDLLDVGVTVVTQTYSYGSAPTGILDLRGSQQFNVNVGRVRLGVHTSTSALDGVPTSPSLDGLATPASVSPLNTEVYLATSNTITATSSFILADAQSASTNGIHKLQFGEGTNVINSPLVYFGYRKGSGQATIRNGGTLDIKGVATGAASTLYIGYSAVNTGAATTSFLDMTGGRLTASLSSLIIGWKGSGGSTTAGSSIGSLILGSDSGNLITVSGNVIIGYVAGTQASAVTFGSGLLSMAGGSFTVGGNVEMATWAGTSTASSNPNMTSTGTLTLTGGTFTVQGNITHTADARSTATINLEGGTLDMTSGNIGGPGLASITLIAKSGTLNSLAQLNGGGNVVKTTTGTLRLTGTNTYTGQTQVNAGTFLVNGTHTGGAQYTVATGATLGGSGSITPASGQDIAITGKLVVGDTSTQAATLTVTTSGGGALVFNN